MGVVGRVVVEGVAETGEVEDPMKEEKKEMKARKNEKNEKAEEG